MHDLDVKIIENRYSLKHVVQRLKKHKLALLGGGVILILCLMAVLAPWLAPHDPLSQNLQDRLLPPGGGYPLGTDNLGRCVASRIIYGSRVTLQVGVMVVLITATVGILAGSAAGYLGGWLDELIMRGVDILLAFPGLILSLAIAGILGPSLYSIMLALSLVGWTGYARVVRGSILSAKEKDYVLAARSLGIKDKSLLLHHIMPNILAPVIVMATMGMAHVMLSAAALSFLGLGLQPPYPEWGSMLNAGRPFMRTAPHLTVFPGLAIMLTVMAFNFLGDGLRDALDPTFD
jgi:peptide/nickel transport system permease protein